MNPILIFSQLPNKEEATEIARTLILKKLAACVHILPKGSSTYMWEDRLCVSEEHQIHIKTTENLFLKVSQIIESLSSYEIPEILFIRLDGGNEKYLQWISLTTHS